MQRAPTAAEKALIKRLPQGSPAAKAGYAFISDEPTQTIFVFDPSGNVTGVVTKNLYYPEGLATDNADNLYVANAGDSNILVFAKPYQGTPFAYQDTGEVPSGVAVTPDGGLIGVTNIVQQNNNPPGNVVFYRKGSAQPCAVVSSPNIGEYFFGAFDAAGDFFIDGLQTPIGPTALGEIKGGCNATSVQMLTTSNTIGDPGGIQVAQNGDVSIEDQGGAIDTYAPPSNGSFGTPLSTAPLSGAKDPVSFAFALNDKYVVTADAVNTDAPVYAFPAGGAAVRTFRAPFSEPLGTAVIPNDR